jgi:hypothetical protein
VYKDLWIHWTNSWWSQALIESIWFLKDNLLSKIIPKPAIEVTRSRANRIYESNRWERFCKRYDFEFADVKRQRTEHSGPDRYEFTNNHVKCKMWTSLGETILCHRHERISYLFENERDVAMNQTKQSGSKWLPWGCNFYLVSNTISDLDALNPTRKIRPEQIAPSEFNRRSRSKQWEPNNERKNVKNNYSVVSFSTKRCRFSTRNSHCKFYHKK